MNLTKRALAELLGTFWLVFCGCGAAVLASKIPGVGIGYAGVAFAFGLAMLTGGCALGGISGGHFNPAVTIGLTVAKRFPPREVGHYIGAQVVGAIIAAFLLFLIASGAPGFDAHASGFATNGYGAYSPDGYNLASALLIEIVMTFVFVLVILGVTDSRVPSTKSFPAIAIGLTLAAIHLVTIPVTNTSVNPARSTGPALFAGGAALSQLWLFWLAPIVGAIIAGKLYPLLAGEDTFVVERTLPPASVRTDHPATAHT